MKGFPVVAFIIAVFVLSIYAVDHNRTFEAKQIQQEQAAVEVCPCGCGIAVDDCGCGMKFKIGYGV